MARELELHGFGRLPSEPDSRDYKMADALLGLQQLELPERIWHSDITLNQFNEPACTGFAWAGWGICVPVEDKWTNAMGTSIYRAAKRIDGFPKAAGSTVRASAKVMLSRGHFKSYFFAADILEAARYVGRYGPVVLGTDWYAGMMKPSRLFHIMPVTGAVVGGHAYLWVGLKRIGRVVYAVILNSWGAAWGKNGYALIALSDLIAIFRNNGEACAATELVLPKAA